MITCEPPKILYSDRHQSQIPAPKALLENPPWCVLGLLGTVHRGIQRGVCSLGGKIFFQPKGFLDSGKIPASLWSSWKRQTIPNRYLRITSFPFSSSEPCRMDPASKPRLPSTTDPITLRIPLRPSEKYKQDSLWMDVPGLEPLPTHPGP